MSNRGERLPTISAHLHCTACGGRGLLGDKPCHCQDDNPFAQAFSPLFNKEEVEAIAAIAVAGVHYKSTVELVKLRTMVEEICQQRIVPPKVRSQLRHAAAGIDWRKVR